MIPKTLLLGCLAVLVSSCAIPFSFSPCPMVDLYEYLSCADPHFSWNYRADPHSIWNYEERDPKEREDELRMIAESAISYCSDDPTEWLPVLDRNVKKSVPKARKTIRDRLKAADGEKLNEKGLKLPPEDHDILEQQYRSLKDAELSSYVLGLYVLGPSLGGRNDAFANTEKCTILFERLEISGMVEDGVQKRFFSQFDWYFGL